MGRSSVRWLVTGGSGFIGRNLVKRLLDDGHTVTIVDRRRPSGEFLAAIGSESAERMLVREYDVENMGLPSWRSELIGVGHVVHLAAVTGLAECREDPEYSFRVNVAATDTLLRALRKMYERPSLVFASSGAVLGGHRPPLHPRMTPSPTSYYGALKAAGEALVTGYGLEGDRRHAWSLRLANVYGPWCEHKRSVVPTFLRCAAQGEPLQIHGSGRQSRDFVCVSDVVDAILIAASSDAFGAVAHIGSGVECSILELADEVRKATETSSGTEMVRGKRALGSEASCMDLSATKLSLVGWSPRVALQDGLTRTARWIQER